MSIDSASAPAFDSEIYKAYFDSPNPEVISNNIELKNLPGNPGKYVLVPKRRESLYENLEILCNILKMKPKVQDETRYFFIENIAAHILQSSDYSMKEMIDLFLCGRIEFDSAKLVSRKHIMEQWCQGMLLVQPLYPLSPMIDAYIDNILERAISGPPLTMDILETTHHHILRCIIGTHDLLFFASVLKNQFIKNLGEYMWPLFRALAIPIPFDAASLDFLLYECRVPQLSIRFLSIPYNLNPRGRKVICRDLVMIGAHDGENPTTVINLDEPLVIEQGVRIRIASLKFTAAANSPASPMSLIHVKGVDRWNGFFEFNDLNLCGGGIFTENVSRIVFERCKIQDAVIGVRFSNVVDALFVNTSELFADGHNLQNCTFGYVGTNISTMRFHMQRANHVGRLFMCTDITTCEVIGMNLTDGGATGQIHCDHRNREISLQGCEFCACEPHLDGFPLFESMVKKSSVSKYPSEKIPPLVLNLHLAPALPLFQPDMLLSDDDLGTMTSWGFPL